MSHEEEADDPPAWTSGPALCLTYAQGRRVAARLVDRGYVGAQRGMLGYHIGRYLHALEFGRPCDHDTAVELLEALELQELIQ